MMLTRRSMLKLAAASLAAPALCFADAGNADKLILCAPLTHSDWYLKPGMAWGPDGVRHMLDACKACGWSRIFWRAFDAGRSTYKSKLLAPGEKPEADSFYNPQTDEDRALLKKYSPGVTQERIAAIQAAFEKMDYGSFDSLAAAVDYGHKIGLQIHAWCSINEDDHGWGWRSEFAKAHPEFRWIRRDGRPYHSQMSFAYPQVPDYKLALIDELLSNYEIDGLFLDWIRTGDVRDNPQNDPTGAADYGYEKPNVDAFKSKYGSDPKDVPNNDERWVKLRAEPQTIFMRAVRERMNKDPKRRPVCVMVGHPWHYRGLLDKIDGNLRGLLLDVSTWADEGLMDSAIAAGYYRDGGDANKAFTALKEETRGKVDLWYYGWVPNSVAEFDRDFNAAKQLGAKQLLFWEADYIDDRANAAQLKAAMSAKASA